MGTRVRALTTCFTVVAMLVATTPTWAEEQHVVDSTVLQQAIAEHAATDAANRQTIDRVLARPDVAAVAARMGLDLKDARGAIATLDSQDLALVAQQAGAVESDLAGGQRTIVISVTTLLLIIIIILLIAD
jgi:hypothetical protein